MSRFGASRTLHEISGYESFQQWCRSVDGRSWREIDKALTERPPWWRIDAVVALSALIFVLLATVSGWLAALIVLLGAFAAMAMAARRYRESYRRTCVAAIPDALSLMSAAISAGHSLDQAILTTIKAKSPLAGEFSRVQLQTRLGESLPDALTSMANRLRSSELRWVAVALRVNARVGGDIAQLLIIVAHTIRERDILQRTTRALSAEGRLSAIVLALLPPGFAVLLLITQPTYVQPLVVDPRGRVILLAAVGLFVGGALWMKRAIRIKES